MNERFEDQITKSNNVQAILGSKMAVKYFALVLVVLCSFPAFVRGKCPCEDESLCKPIETPPRKEFFMFSTKPNVWRKYDWTKVTTIAIFRPWDDELMCEAHKRVSEKNALLLQFYCKKLFF